MYSSALFAVLFLIANVTVYLIFSKMSVDRELKQFAAETEQASEAIRRATDPIAAAELLRAYVPLNGMIRIVKESGAGNRLLVTSSSETELSGREAVFFAQKKTELLTIGGRAYGFVSIPVIGADGEVANVQATESIEELMQLLGMLRLVLIVVTAIAMIPVVLSSGVLGSLIMRPIAAMTKTMGEIARSGKFMRLKPDNRSKDELAEMGETFNNMIGLLERNFARQEQFVSNASHELKTPLTIIESYASLLKRRGLDRPELFLESVEAIHSEAVRMKGMTEQLLLLAMPRKQWEMAFAEVDLNRVAEQAVGFFRGAYAREITLETEMKDGIITCTDADKLLQLLFIFLDNARKYSTDPIAVSVGKNRDEGCIRVTDRGIGIPREELPRVFERFYRVDKARSRDTEQEGGTGLGLSLAKEIADALGARIVLDSVEGLGTTATVYIPGKSGSSGTSSTSSASPDGSQ